MWQSSVVELPQSNKGLNQLSIFNPFMIIDWVLRPKALVIIAPHHQSHYLDRQLPHHYRTIIELRRCLSTNITGRPGCWWSSIVVAVSLCNLLFLVISSRRNSSLINNYDWIKRRPDKIFPAINNIDQGDNRRRGGLFSGPGDSVSGKQEFPN